MEQESQEVTEQQKPTPVSQVPETIGFSVGAAFMGSGYVAKCVELATSGDASPENIISTTGLAAGATLFLGMGAIRAYQETKAYKQASEEERQSDKAKKHRLEVQGFRTAMWGMGIAYTGMFSAVGLNSVIEGGSTPKQIVGAGLAAVATMGIGKTISGFKASREKSKQLKTQLDK